jgi:hypothetical protein
MIQRKGLGHCFQGFLHTPVPPPPHCFGLDHVDAKILY